jgi:hypothetical protein
MALSISHFKSRIPARAAVLLLTAAAVWGLSIAYTLHWNPEVRNWQAGANIKIRWSEKMTQEYGSKILVYGGSSCSFSIDGERMLDRFNLPTVNFGRGADMGPTVLTESVLDYVRPGDTLIVAIEPGLLTESFDVPALGVQFSYAMHHPEWVRHPQFDEPGVSWFQALAALRPGGFHMFTILGKIASGKRLFRYQLSDYHPSGWEQTDVRVKITGPLDYGTDLSGNARALLGGLRDWCAQRHVRIAYSLPWCYTPAEKMKSFQERNVAILMQVNDFIPVLKDAHLGADTNLDDFADTQVHLTGPAAALRSDELAGQIKNWDLWTAEELRQHGAQPGNTVN